MLHLFGVQNLRDINYRNIQYTQNEALRIATGCHNMSSVYHLHVEAEIMKVREHSELLSYLHSIWLDVWNQEMSATSYYLICTVFG